MHRFRSVSMPADPAGAGPPLPLPPQRNAGPGDAAALSAEEADRLHYADLPLGLANPTVLAHGTSSGELGSSLTSGRCRYLCYFLHRHLEFRLPEVESLAAMAGGTGRGSSSMSSDSGSGGAAAAAAVVWEKPFGNRVRLPAMHACPSSHCLALQLHLPAVEPALTCTCLPFGPVPCLDAVANAPG